MKRSLLFVGPACSLGLALLVLPLEAAPEEAIQIQVLPGFQANLIYTVPKDSQGSWVSMAEDDKGRLITSDQFGGLFRVTVPAIGSREPAKVEPLRMPNGTTGKPLPGAQGMLYTAGSLYLMINGGGNSGLWRLRDADGDDQFDTAECLRKCTGGGEHGPHGLALSPDGKSIYFAVGNMCKLPENLDYSRPIAASEDHLTPRLWDPSGFCKGLLAPGGYVCKTDLDGKRVELLAAGFRNHYDLAFDPNGELFTFDSDMEWDLGLPWYMPIRVNHVVNGGEYGWRSGAGRWPAYYADSLPAVVDVGVGSPTGVLFGTGAKYPAKYQRAMFGLDWAFGKIWAIHLQPDGASFKADKEEFVTGKALPFTDALIRPQDGAMYFITGGRKSQSVLYRISYTGQDSTAPAAPIAPAPLTQLRREVEALQEQGNGPEVIAKAWPALAHPDRFIRFAARVAIEHQPADQWAERALAETQPQAAIEALIALARLGDKSLQPRLLAALGRFDFAQLPAALQLPYLRAWQLTFTRMGKPAPEVCATIADLFAPQFPTADLLTNRELVTLLVYLDSPTIVAQTVPLLDATMDVDHPGPKNDHQPNCQAIAYAYALRVARNGWTPVMRTMFFSWFSRTAKWRGANSYTGYLDNIRTLALANCVTDAGERATLTTLSQPPAPPAAELVVPKGPGKNYSADDIAALAKDGLSGRNFAQGKAMFSSCLCINCHHFNGTGGNVGPDITGAGSRYSVRDLAENIVEPSKIISDLYASEQIDLKDGGQITGRVAVEEEGKLYVMVSALTPDVRVPIAAANVKSRQPCKISMMPAGLLNALNPDELRDLLAYLLAAGNPKDPRF